MSEVKQRNKNLTIPNLLSVIRILLIPFIAYYFINDNILVSVILICISGLSDLFDGFIARKFNQITELGKMLDPLADKMTQGVVAICLMVKYPPVRIILIIFVLKELLMLIFSIILLRKKKRPTAAMWYGKVATTLFYISVAVIVIMSAFMNVEQGVFVIVSNTLLAITAAVMVYSAYKYFRIFLVIIRSDDEKYKFDLPDEIRAKRDVIPRIDKKQIKG